MSDKPLLEALGKVSVEAAWAVLHERGYPNCFIAGLQVVHPELVMTGRARTLRYVPHRPDLAAKLEAEGPLLHKQSVEACSPGEVLVVDACGVPNAGVAGDIILTRFLQKGGAGVVVEGSLRDLTYLRQIPLPLYTRAVHAAYSLERILGVEENVPVHVAGVCVLPGDYLLGDAEGVLVIPQALVADVIAEAAETDQKELFIRQKLQQGASLLEAYPPNAALLEEYRLWKEKKARN